MATIQLDSDTESDSSHSEYNTCADRFINYTPSSLESMQSGSQDGIALRSTSSVNCLFAAVEDLFGIDIVQIDLDVSIDDSQRILHASYTITGFLENLMTITDPETLCNDGILGALHGICKFEVLDRFFEFRRVFHRIASRETRDSAAAVVSWVDVILARLGDAIQHVVYYSLIPSARGFMSDDSKRMLLAHREEGALKAALQLPESWLQTTQLLASVHASPAAIRLTMRLLYAGTVLGCPIGERRDWPYDTGLDVLCSFICKYQTEGFRYDNVHLALEDRTVLAMAISMFAMIDCAKCEQPDHSFRPHAQATLLRQIANVMKCSQADWSSTLSAEPIVPLGMPQEILVRWGMVVPWCWTVWNDERFADYEIIETLTSTWIYHLGRHIPCEVEWEQELSRCVAFNPFAACTALTITLRRSRTFLRESVASGTGSLSNLTLDVVGKCCWGLRELTRILDDHEQHHLRQAGMYLCDLFAILGLSADEMAVKDAIITFLAHMCQGELSDTLQEASESTTLQAKARLDSVNRKMDLAGQTRDSLKAVDFHNCCQSLQFMTLIWQVDGTLSDFFFLQSVSRFLGNLLRKFSAENVANRQWDDSEIDNADKLLPVLITALASMEFAQGRGKGFEQLNKSWDHGLIWKVMSNYYPEDILMTSAFASYVAAVDYPQGCDTMTICEAWDLFRDFLLLLTQSHFLGPQEALSLIICPTVLEATDKLLKTARSSTVTYITSSPWTISLSEYLRHFSASRDEAEYHEFVSDTLAPLIEQLTQRIRTCLEGTDQGSVSLIDSSKNVTRCGRTLSCIPTSDKSVCLLLLKEVCSST